MKRRDLLAVLGGVMVALRASAVNSAAPARVGFVSGGNEEGAAGFVAALRNGLAAEGYYEPDTLSLECLYADYSLERVPALVAELERHRVELIVTHAAATSIVVKGYRTVPVVYEFSADPVATGLAASLAHPGSNLTGFTGAGAELSGKRVQLLKDAVPGASRIAALRSPEIAISTLRATQEAANTLGLELHIVEVALPDEIPAGFDGGRSRRTGARRAARCDVLE
jgi:putative ABC transport system substrate-binding protein